jgi:prophage regulatory protein
MAAASSKRAIRWPELSRKVPWTRQWLSYLEKQNKFPRRFRLGDNSVAWFEDEVDRWLDERAAQRDQHEEEAAT